MTRDGLIMILLLIMALALSATAWYACDPAPTVEEQVEAVDPHNLPPAVYVHEAKDLAPEAWLGVRDKPTIILYARPTEWCLDDSARLAVRDWLDENWDADICVEPPLPEPEPLNCPCSPELGEDD